MSLKEALLGFIDNVRLPAIFSRKTENLQELRQPLLKGISNTKRQFANGQTRAPHRWWQLSNDVVALTVKIKGTVFTINGVETNHIPSDRFADFLDKFTAAVDAGDFDDELRHNGAGDATVKIPRAKRAAAKPVQTPKSLAATAPEATKEHAVPSATAASVRKSKPLAAKAGMAARQTSKQEDRDTKAASSEEPTAVTLPATGQAPAEPNATPKPSAGKTAKAAAPKPKRKPVDAKTAYARAKKAAATRADNKARKAASASISNATSPSSTSES